MNRSSIPTFRQLLLLLLFILLGSFVALFIGSLATAGIYGGKEAMQTNAGAIRLFQFISALGMFLLPSLLMGWIVGKNIKSYLSIGGVPPLKLLIATFISMLLIAPSINLLGYFNSLMELPDALAPLEAWMKEQEEAAESITLKLLNDNYSGAIVANLFVVALTAAVTEEFLFRGALERIIGGWTTNHHLVIWTAAVLFSAFHLQFYGFLPRMLLGAYFGYLLYWSRNIWLPVFAHFTNNAIAVIGMSDSRLKENELFSGDFSESNLWAYGMISIVGIILFFLLVNHQIIRMSVHATTCQPKSLDTSEFTK